MKFLSYIYYLITTCRNFLYDAGILRVRSVPGVEIICIGNITVGGTGKTPAVQYYTKRLRKMGKKVAVVSRGYRGKRKREPLLVSDGKMIFSTAFESGDESYMHALNLNVPVIVSVNRRRGCLFAKKHFDVDTIILDDGFQHRKLKRDRDIVLIDATNPFGYRELLPKGRLRESFKKALPRASEFIITKSDLAGEKEVEKVRRFLKFKENKAVSLAKHGVVSLCDMYGNPKPLFWIKDKRILLFSGLANPLNFEKTVISLNPSYIERIDFMDHHNLKIRDLNMIQRRAESIKASFILTTEKDMVKMPENFVMENLLVLKIEFTMIEDHSLKPLEKKYEKGTQN
ncbi:MAG: tetraacyldisaccharide 4'-kinase [Fusobacteriaceae bacterium]|jgi:tetraacyldisaccharide 4'-kinase|nr:tetraacyldisaccharide 4'-kinase [Fusobacteriaceae bacterium]